MVKQFQKEVEDIDFNYRKICRVKFEGSPTWWPVTLDEAGETLRQLGLIDGYDSETQRIWVEREVDYRFDRERGIYDPVLRTDSQDIRDFLRGCSWDEYNRIFADADQI